MSPSVTTYKNFLKTFNISPAKAITPSKTCHLAFVRERFIPKQTAIAQAIDFLKTNWLCGKSLKEIAHLYCVDAGNLERAFRKQEGMTVKQFVDQKRKEHVLARLADKKFLGYAIGAELGFGNDLAFYRWVKRAFGVSFVELRGQAHAGFESGASDKKSLVD